MKQESLQEKRKKAFMLVLPLLVLPFLALGFYALGGGKDAGVAVTGAQGINARLPGAQLAAGKGPDKLALYEQHQRDSVRERSRQSGGLFSQLGFDTAAVTGGLPADRGRGLAVGTGSAQHNEALISQRLAQIRQEMDRPVKQAGDVGGLRGPVVGSVADEQAARLEQLLRGLKKGGAGVGSAGAPDPEMQQLNGMLEKIMDIQHPERVKERAAAIAEKGRPDSLFKAFRAVVVHKAKVLPGSSVELRLLDTLVIKGQVVLPGAALFGVCQVANQRLLLSVKSIRLGTSILPVDLTVCDYDGMEGIRAKDAVMQDALRSGSDQAVQSLQLLSMEPTLATQAAGAGLETAKSLFSKKVKRVKVGLAAGYPVLLRNNHPLP
ncbi:MAG: conjugative transposon protein TraM [Bacteroidota bacterium]